jgi:hypothetical protein
LKQLPLPLMLLLFAVVQTQFCKILRTTAGTSAAAAAENVHSLHTH